MKKILFFIQNGVGGAERMTVNIAKLLPVDQYELVFCKIVIPCIPQNGRIDDFIPKGAKITNIVWNGQISFLRQLKKILNIIKPDISFSSTMPVNQRLLLLSRSFPDIKFIVRNDNYLFTLTKLKKATMRHTYKRADLIVAQTEEMKSELESLGLEPNKIITLHNLIDSEQILKKSREVSPFPNDGKPRFVSVGRLAPQKGFDILIKAFAKVVKKLPEAELYIVGSTEVGNNPIYSKLLEIIKGNNLENKVHFTGYTDNPYRYLKNASAFVLSSRYEGLPNVLVEAQFLKTPSAATKCIPIISRMIKDGENGYLAESENPESLAEAMIKTLDIKEVKQIYKPSSREDFIKIFQ